MSAPEQIQNLIEVTTMTRSEAVTAIGSNDQNNKDAHVCSNETSLDPTFAAMRRRRHHGSSKTSSRSSSSSSARKRKRRRSSTESSAHISVSKLAVSCFTPISGNENKGNCSPSSCSSGSGSSSSDNGGSSSEGEEEDALFEQDQSSQLLSSSQCKNLSIDKGPLFLTTVNSSGTYSSDDRNSEGSYSNSFTTFTSTMSNTAPNNSNLDSNDIKKYGSLMNESSASTSTSTSANTNSNSNLNNNRRNPNLNQNVNSSIDESNGWRVKLYSLNSDGSWDDCGTGRITCIFNDPISRRPLISDDYSDDSFIYRELGEPTLCMRSELPQQSINASSSPANSTSLSVSTNNAEIPKILLKTRILLRQVYNRQGDNIITWCEPYFPNIESTDSEINSPDINGENLANGVDLALSFQDNAGCLDIWRQITSVQSRAADLIRERGINAAFSPSPLLTNSNFSSSHAMPKSSSSNYPTLTSNMNTGTDAYADSDQSNSSVINGHSNAQEQSDEEPSTNHTIEETSSSSTTMQLSTEAMEAARHAQIHHQQQHEQARQNQSHHIFSSSNSSYNEEHESYPDTDNESAAVSMSSIARFQQQNPFDISSISCKLPTPNLSNLEEISDIFAASQIQQREALATYLSKNDCAYVKSLLALFPSAEKKDDFNILATLALSIKTILLLNDHPIIELIVMEEDLFENVCSVLEFDPDLRVKANHRWFIRERVKFKTVVKMENENLVSAIHRIFRVNYLRDTLLRPTMDESSLSSLASLLKFTQREVVEGVISPYHGEDEKASIDKKHVNQTSYLIKVLRMIGREMKAIREIEHEALLDSSSNIGGIEKDRSHQNQSSTFKNGVQNQNSSSSSIDSTSLEIDTMSSISQPSTIGASTSLWKQHVIPQDPSLSSRKLRRHGCLMFLRELLNMVRGIMQQSEKDYYAMIVCMSFDLKECSKENQHSNEQKLGNNTHSFKQESSLISQTSESSVADQISLLSLMSAIISDPNAEICDRSAALEILSSIVMHDPTLVRKHCLAEYATITSKLQNHANYPRKSEPNEHRQVLFRCESNDLLLSLLYLMAVETDAGLLLQTSEILRIILDTEMLEQGPLVGCVEDETSSVSHGATLEQNKFLALFYEHYVQWLVAPFQYNILISRLSSCFGMKPYKTEDLLQHSVKMPKCAIRSNFAVELLCFCVRAHIHRMKIFVLKNCVLRSVLKLMNESTVPGGNFGHDNGGNRCLKLACLRFLRAVLSVKDEFYHRHIIKHNLFEIVFQTFRRNPVGDNLVSSAIVEICDLIRNENIKSLLEHIVTDHLSQTRGDASSKMMSLEEVSTPYVDTLTLLRKRYEENIGSSIERNESKDMNSRNTAMKNGVSNQTSYFMNNAVSRGGLSGKALEDQRKFRENDEEDSYFNDDDDEKDESSSLHSSSPALEPTHLASIEKVDQESDDVRAIQLECKLGLAMVQYSSSSDEDDDDILSGERSNSGNENREGSTRSLKRTSLVGIKGGRKPKIQVLMNSKSRVKSNSSKSTNEAQHLSLPTPSEDTKNHSNDGVLKPTYTSAIPNISTDADQTNI